MFEFYTRNIDPDDPGFQTYIKQYVSTRDSRSPNTIPYSDLYRMIKEGIREYLRKAEGTERRSKK